MPLDGLLEVDAESGEDEAEVRGKKVRGASSETAVSKVSTTVSETSTVTSRGARAGSKSYASESDEPSIPGNEVGEVLGTLEAQAARWRLLRRQGTRASAARVVVQAECGRVRRELVRVAPGVLV